MTIWKLLKKNSQMMNTLKEHSRQNWNEKNTGKVHLGKKLRTQVSGADLCPKIFLELRIRYLYEDPMFSLVRNLAEAKYTLIG